MRTEPPFGRRPIVRPGTARPIAGTAAAFSAAAFFAITFLSVAFLAIGGSGSLLADEARGITSIDFDGLVDLRTYAASRTEASMEGGFGKHRYGGDGDDGQVSADPTEALLRIFGRLDWDITARVTLQAETQQDAPIDILDGFVAYRPVPNGAWQPHGRVGVFFPPISLENESIGWTSPYSVTPSAINSWIGEEIRIIGTELGTTYRGVDTDLDLSGGLFIGNDPAGVLLAYRGWGLSDRKPGLFDETPAPTTGGGTLHLRPFLEIDSRPGAYLSASLEDTDFGEWRIMGYHNFGDPGATYNEMRAWRTWFLAGGTRWPLVGDTELLAQAMAGNTKIVPDHNPAARVETPFAAAYVMVTRPLAEAHRLSLRVDRFVIDDRNPAWGGRMLMDEEGWALTMAALTHIDEQQRLTAELIRTSSHRPGRATADLPEETMETLFQLSWRYYF